MVEREPLSCWSVTEKGPPGTIRTNQCRGSADLLRELESSIRYLSAKGNEEINEIKSTSKHPQENAVLITLFTV